MKKHDKQKLIELLAAWFKQANFDKATIYYRDPVLILMKRELERVERWKNAPRGNSQPPKNQFHYQLRPQG
jgi:hypothetical protein